MTIFFFVSSSEKRMEWWSLFLILTYPIILTNLYVKLGFHTFLVFWTWVNRCVLDESELLAAIQKLSLDCVQTHFVILSDMARGNELLHLVSPSFILFLHKNGEILTAIITAVIVACVLSHFMGPILEWFFQRKNKQTKSLEKIKEKLFPLERVNKEKFDYYSEHLEALLESIENDLSKAGKKM